MKLRLIALAALAASGSSFALDIPTTLAIPAGNVLRIYGASAQTPMLEGYLKDVCTVGTFDTYKRFSSSGSTNSRAWSCTLAAPIKTGALGYSAGDNILVIKRDQGGSVYGVSPLVSNSAQKALKIDPTTCTLVSANNYTCTTDDTLPADAGMSDVEPTWFTKKYTVYKTGAGTEVRYLNLPNTLGGAAVNTDDSGVTFLQNVTALDVAPVGQTIFGVAVSDGLFTKLQTVQGVAIPSIPKAFIAGALAGFVRNTAADTGTRTWAKWSSLTGDAADDVQPVTICRRTQGSGTQASSNEFFLANGTLLSAATGMLAPVYSTTGPDTFDNSVTGLSVFEGNSGGAVVDSCLSNGAGVAKAAYAIGVVSRETSDAGKVWKYVKIDGAGGTMADTQAQARVGAYGLVFTSTMQFNKTNLVGNKLGAIKEMRAKMASPNKIFQYAGGAKEGLLALPSQWNNAATTCGTAGGNDKTYGSCVERLDVASKYNNSKWIYGQNGLAKTNSAQALHLVK